MPRLQGNSEAFARWAGERFAAAGVDMDGAIDAMLRTPVSLQCWQGDDVQGFERQGLSLGGGLAVTGAHPGRARNADELREDLGFALSLIPGTHRVNLHASYGEFGDERVGRDGIEPRHFARWVDWARSLGIGLDFNPTFFGHSLAVSGFTLSHPDPGVRGYWIEHGRRSRGIGAMFARELDGESTVNVWVPDGYKDQPADRRGPRDRLVLALDEVFRDSLPGVLDSVEGKLFGIGVESYTVGSHEFYLGYAATRRKWWCLDAGHFHPTESVADKVSAVLSFVPGLLIHASRGVRWDSDHVVALDDGLMELARESVSAGPARVRWALDYFDASIDRVVAWVLGARNVQKAILMARMEPPGIREAEVEGDLTRRLVLQQEARALPWGAAWDLACLRACVARDGEWLPVVQEHERRIRRARGVLG